MPKNPKSEIVRQLVRSASALMIAADNTADRASIGLRELAQTASDGDNAAEVISWLSIMVASILETTGTDIDSIFDRLFLFEIEHGPEE